MKNLKQTINEIVNGTQIFDIHTHLFPADFKKYHLSLGAGLTEVAGKVFRIGHLGDLNELQASAFINGAEMAMIDSGINVKPGSGIAAASEYWRKALENDAKVQNISNKEVA